MVVRKSDRLQKRKETTPRASPAPAKPRPKPKPKSKKGTRAATPHASSPGAGEQGRSAAQPTGATTPPPPPSTSRLDTDANEQLRATPSIGGSGDVRESPSRRVSPSPSRRVSPSPSHRVSPSPPPCQRLDWDRSLAKAQKTIKMLESKFHFSYQRLAINT
jgi:hypothetical protein